ncbi:hypothetical protein [Streptomyces sp. NRRL F-5123]|uniref:hypothetical protein n=1 Tax=Streptomyces sp. NRRL F-5123 TaxID=1463856 RepID=UPI0004E0C202|nr:hypothetical protein [Streptomyces sp. NRRL F-5123]
MLRDYLITGTGHDDHDPFGITVRRVAENDVEHARESADLHPVVRHYRDGGLDGVHRVAENVENGRDLPTVLRRPLAAFVAAGLG